MKKKLATAGLALALTTMLGTSVGAADLGYDYRNGMFDNDPEIYTGDDSVLKSLISNSLVGSIQPTKTKVVHFELDKVINPKAMTVSTTQNTPVIVTFSKFNDATGEYEEVNSLSTVGLNTVVFPTQHKPISFEIPNPTEFDRVSFRAGPDVSYDAQLNMLEFYEELSGENIYDTGLFDTTDLTITSKDENAHEYLTDNTFLTDYTDLYSQFSKPLEMSLSDYVKADKFMVLMGSSKSGTAEIQVDFNDSETGETVYTVSPEHALSETQTVQRWIDIPADIPAFNEIIITHISTARIYEIELFGELGKGTIEPEQPEEQPDEGEEDTGGNTGGDTSAETDVDFNLVSGGLLLEASPILTFGDITLQSVPTDYTTSFESPFNVKDLRGTQEGWRLDVSSTQFEVVEPAEGFKAGTQAHKLPKGSLSLTPLESITQVGTGGVEPSSLLTQNKVVDDGVSTVAEANVGQGSGEYDLQFPDNALTLTIDASTAKLDNTNYPNMNTPYQAVVSWELVSAP